MVRRGWSCRGSLWSCRGSGCPLDLRPREWIVGVRTEKDGSMVRLKPLSIVTNWFWRLRCWHGRTHQRCNFGGVVQAGGTWI